MLNELSHFEEDNSKEEKAIKLTSKATTLHTENKTITQITINHHSLFFSTLIFIMIDFYQDNHFLTDEEKYGFLVFLFILCSIF